MPELPEVETIARALRQGGRGAPGAAGLTPSVLGMTIRQADLLWGRTLAEPAAEELSSRLSGQSVQSVGRRGKFILIELSRDWLIFHLRMSGDLYLQADDTPPSVHDRLVIWFKGGWRLTFNDARKFGRVWLVGEPQSVLGGLGPEPLGEELNGDLFYSMLKVRRRQLKPLLLDQTFVAGIGNIYADEALFAARLHPLSASDRLSQDQAEVLRTAIQAVLEAGIARQGASIDWVYRGGDFQNTFQVYQRTGKPCPNCGGPIERIVVGQRSTHFCPRCQVLVEHRR